MRKDIQEKKPIFHRKDIQDKKLLFFRKNIQVTQLVFLRKDIHSIKPILLRKDTFRIQSQERYSGYKSAFSRKDIQDRSVYFLRNIFMVEGQYFGRNSSAESFTSEY